MKHLTTTALAALLVGSLGALALAPAASAEDSAGSAAPAVSAPATPSASTDIAAAGDNAGPGRFGPRGGMMGRMGGMMGGMGHFGMPGGFAGRAGLLDFACSPRAAEALEIAFVHIDYAVKPTAEQAPLFDALKTTALADQKKVADTCQTALNGNAGTATMLDRLQTRLTLDNARVAALTDVLPKFKAFYDSLTDQQKTQLEPQQRQAGARYGSNGWGNHQGWHRFGPGMGRMHRMMPQPNAAAPSNDSAAPAQPDDPAAQDSNT